MKRRTFLKGGLAAGLVVALPACSLIPVTPKRPQPTAEAAMGWVSCADGQYQLILPRIEIGQNIATAIKQIACEELGIEWDELSLDFHSTATIDQVKSTVGSESIKDFAVPLAQACATLRDAIAAGRSTGEIGLVERPLSDLRIFAAAPRYIGRRPPLEQGQDIVRGQSLYAADIRRENMIYGRVLRAPVSPELPSQPVRWDMDAARAVPGFVDIVDDPSLKQAQSKGLGILAKTPSTLDRIADALNVQWDIDGTFEQHDIDNAVDIERRLNSGRLANTIQSDSIEDDSRWDVDLRFDIPLGAHGPIEPRAAVAEFDQSGALTVWAGVQDVFFVRDTIARALSLDSRDVDVKSRRVGGAFGGKTMCTVELEAALLARAAGHPVKVQWTRAQEYRQGFHRPPSSHRIRATLKEDRLDSWWHGFASSHILFSNAVLPEWMQQITDFIGDPGVARGADMPYRAKNRRTEFDLVRIPVFTGPWRGLGAGPNMLAIESAIDECAIKTNADPVAFRRSHIEDPRLADVLNSVAEISNWQGAKPTEDTPTYQGRGVACGIYKETSYAAVVADVSISRDGNIQVTHLWCAHDCGHIINPDQVRAQCEGNLVWGLGMVLSDQLPVENARVAAETFADAPIPRLEDVSPMTIELISNRLPPTGAGETAIVAASGAIANAVRNATGVRPTRFPIDPKELVRSQA